MPWATAFWRAWCSSIAGRGAGSRRIRGFFVGRLVQNPPMNPGTDRRSSPGVGARPPSPHWGRWIAAVVGLTVMAGVFRWVDVRALLRDALVWIEGLGLWGPVWFVVIYAVATVLLVPGSIMTLGAGAIFGVVKGSVIASVAATAGAAAAFLTGRYLARGWVEKRIEGHAAFSALNRAVADEGWKIVGLTRLSPIFPFTLLNYAFGVTHVRFWQYVLASWIGMIPGTVMYVYLGSLVRTGSEDRERTAIEWIAYGVGLAATVAVTVVITRLARKALARRVVTDGENQSSGKSR